MRRIKLIFLVLCHPPLFTSHSWADTYLGIRELGDPVHGAGARSAAMGGTGLARGGQAAVLRLNPALLADIGKPELSFSAGPAFSTEKVVESPVETRFRNNSRLEVNELSLAIPTRLDRLWLGFSAAPMFDFHYQADSRFYDSTGTLLSTNRLDDSGTLWAVTPALAVGLTDGFALGLSYDFWVGSERLNAFQLKYGAAGFTADLRETADYRGGALRAGLRWRATEKFSLGAAFQPAARLTRSFDFANATAPATNRSGTDKWDMPAQWAVGFSYRVQGEHDTELAAEIRQTDWSEAKIDGTKVNKLSATKPIVQEVSKLSLFNTAPPSPRFYSDVTEIHVGVEHGVTPEWSLRYGFYLVPWFADRSVESTYFTVGAGYEPGERWSWSAAGEFGKRDYKGENLFFPATQRADETFRRILVSGRWKW